MLKEKNIQKLANIFIKDKTDQNFKFLYERLKPGILNHCFGILKDRDLAGDAFLNCMAKIWTKIDQYDVDRGNFSTWCYNIARNESLLLIKSRKRYVNQTESDVEFISALNPMHDSVYELEKDPLWAFAYEENSVEEVYDAIIEEIKNLPTLYKDIMIDREINHMKYKDIAEKYNIKKRSIATRIRRARTKIRKKMETFNQSTL